LYPIIDPIRKGLTSKKGTLKGFNFIARGETPGKNGEKNPEREPL